MTTRKSCSWNSTRHERPHVRVCASCLTPCAKRLLANSREKQLPKHTHVHAHTLTFATLQVSARGGHVGATIRCASKCARAWDATLSSGAYAMRKAPDTVRDGCWRCVNGEPDTVPFTYCFTKPELQNKDEGGCARDRKVMDASESEAARACRNSIKAPHRPLSHALCIYVRVNVDTAAAGAHIACVLLPIPAAQATSLTRVSHALRTLQHPLTHRVHARTSTQSR